MASEIQKMMAELNEAAAVEKKKFVEKVRNIEVTDRSEERREGKECRYR